MPVSGPLPGYRGEIWPSSLGEGTQFMPMVCPSCGKSFERRMSCPDCDSRLEYRGGTVGPVLSSHLPDTSTQWQHSLPGRFFLGLLLSQGLFYGLRNLLMAGVLAAGDTQEEGLWQQVAGVVLSQGLQAICLLVGGVFAGAGQKQGHVLGALIGLANGAIFIAVHQTGILPMSSAFLHEPAVFYALPLVQMAFGTLGGWLGRSIWHPLPDMEPLLEVNRDARPGRRTPARLSPFAGPIAWVRVGIGCALAAGGAIAAPRILSYILITFDRVLVIEDRITGLIAIWEITALAVLLGGSFAGSSTFNGLKQGLCVAIGSCVIILGVKLSSPDFNFDQVLLLCFTAAFFSLVGGWFGGQLFPPLMIIKKASRTEL